MIIVFKTNVGTAAYDSETIMNITYSPNLGMEITYTSPKTMHWIARVLSAVNGIGINDLRIDSLLNRIKEEQIKEPIILHTDQGSVYSSKEYNNLLNDFNIERSMSRAGTPTDNPVNESLNGWIKEELFIDFDLKHSNDVPNLIKLYIDYYNNERPSYALNYKTPIQYKTESGF